MCLLVSQLMFLLASLLKRGMDLLGICSCLNAHEYRFRSASKLLKLPICQVIRRFNTPVDGARRFGNSFCSGIPHHPHLKVKGIFSFLLW